jgi:hypothetical protein
MCPRLAELNGRKNGAAWCGKSWHRSQVEFPFTAMSKSEMACSRQLSSYNVASACFKLPEAMCTGYSRLP